MEKQMRFVIKRDGSNVPVSLQEISLRLEELSNGLNVDHIEVAQYTIGNVRKGVKTSELDIIAAKYCANKVLNHPDYGTFAARIYISNFEKELDIIYKKAKEHNAGFPYTTKIAWYACMMRNNHNHGTPAPLLTEECYNFILANNVELESMLKYSNNYNYTYLGFKLMENTYLCKSNAFLDRREHIECPQLMLMRVCVGIIWTYYVSHDAERPHNDEILAEIKEAYTLMSDMYFTMATPTLFHAGTLRPQLSSCFLLDMAEDSIEGIYDTLKKCAVISKNAGGVGLAVHKIRSRGSYIKGTAGTSNGIAPMLEVFGKTANYVDQCFSGKTIICTDKGHIPIKDVTVGDKVMTSEGVFKKVKKVFAHNVKEEMYDITTISSKVSVTGIHPVLSISGSNSGRNSITYTSASNLSEGDYIAMPVPTTKEDQSYTESEMFIYGAFVASGCSLHEEQIMLFENHTTELLRRIRNYKECNLNAHKVRKYVTEHIELFADEETILDRINYNYTMPLPMLRTLHLSILGCNMKLLSLFLEGFLTHSTYNVVEHLGTSCIELECPYARNLQLILLKFKIAAIIKGTKIIIPITSKIGGILELKPSRHFYYKTTTNCVLAPITEMIKRKAKDKVVYDLEIKDIHNYLTDAGMAHNGGGKRKGNFAIYLEPHHADIVEFLDLKSSESAGIKIDELFYGMWISDYFMKCVEKNKPWYLMDPSISTGLDKVYGDKYKTLYKSYVKCGKYQKMCTAQEIWVLMLRRILEKGVPYVLFKDRINAKSNQKNLGTIVCSNLCTEIFEYCSPTEDAVCNLGSISLKMFCEDGVYNYEKLHNISRILCRLLNKVIDINYYPTKSAECSNKSHRPIGMGVQGLADAFMELRIPFDSAEAADVNAKISETMYHAALTESCELAKKLGHYPSFKGSDLSKGIFHYELCVDHTHAKVTPRLWDFESLRESIMTIGTRNSLMLADMPTGSTSAILGNNECIEPLKGNLILKENKVSEYTISNKYLVNDLMKLGLWDENMQNKLISLNGSVATIDEIPQNIRDLYKTTWEIQPDIMIDMMLDRGAWIDQGQSFNLFLAEPNQKLLNQMYFYIHRRGGKNGSYYVRTKPVDTQKVGLPIAMQVSQAALTTKPDVCYPGCESCSS